MLNRAFRSVLRFHKAFGHPIGREPQELLNNEIGREIGQRLSEIAYTISEMKSAPRLLVRVGWMIEELSELLLTESLTGQVDALIDLIYFALGTFVEMCVRPGCMFRIVQSTNMAKLHSDGRPRFRKDGKIIKPEGWQPPEPQIEEELQRQRERIA